MTRCLLIVLFGIIVNTPIISQFISNERIWKSRYLIFNLQTGAQEDEITRSYFFDGDTLFNDTLYTKMYYHTDSVQTVETDNYYHSSYRSEDNKVFQRINQDGEILIYDFDMNLHDTLEKGITEDNTTYYLVVKNIESMIIEGSQKKLFNIVSGEIEDQDTSEIYYRTILEDYGDLDKAPFYPWCPYSFNFDCSNHELLCIEENESIVYMKPYIFFCYTNTITETNDLESKTEIKIFPNPFENSLILTISQKTSIFNGWILDVQGQKIKQIKIDGLQNEIQLGSISPGLYFLSLWDEKGNSINEKIVKI